MGGLILLIILVPLIFLIILLTLLNRTAEQGKVLDALYDRIKQLNSEIVSLTREIREHQPIRDRPPVQEREPEKKVVPITPKAETKPEPVAAETEPVFQEAVPQKVEQSLSAGRSAKKIHKEHTDLEKFIGENLANKIGIAVLVLGIAFFVKYAIDKDWINEAGRVLIGLACGAILIGLAHYFRNTYRSFSSVLVGGGLSVFYFSIAFAFHQYELIGQTAAFIFMVIISGMGVVLSLYYNRQELAILATIGAFITPFLVSTGKENYIALFTYLCIINGGLMVLSWFKRWSSINIIALLFTTIIYGGWLIKRTIIDDVADLPSQHAFLFATIFYLLFVAMSVINNIRLKNTFRAFDFIIVLGINFLYYAAGMIILGTWSADNKGLFTGLAGIFNLVLAFIFYRKKSIDPNFLSLLIGLAIGFLSLVAPIQFSGNHIVLFWAAESVVLLWLYQRTGITLLKHASLLVAVCLLISMVNNWFGVYLSDQTSLPPILNKGFVTSVVAAVALFLYHYLMPKQSNPGYLSKISSGRVKKAFLFLSLLTAYLAGVFEIWYQFNTRYPEVAIYSSYLQAYTFAFAILLLWIFRKDGQYPLLKFLFTAICLAFYFFNLSINYQVSLHLAVTGEGGIFIAHWIAAGLLLWLLMDLVFFFFRNENVAWSPYSAAFTWGAATGIIILLSVEMYHVILWTNYLDATDWQWWENLYYKAGLSILWGLCSFIMMWFGMKKNFRPLRIISLTLFTVTIVKLFGYDIRNIPPGGKIAAFILLGVLLLAVSFMYQRLKKIIIDNTAG